MTPEMEVVMTKSELDTYTNDIVSKSIEASKKEFTAELEDVKKSVQEVKSVNPFTQIQVKEEQTYPIGRLAIAQAKAHIDRVSVTDVLNNNIKRENSIHDKAALAFLTKSYQMSGKSIGSISTGGGFSDPMTEQEYLSILRPNSVVRQIAGRNITLVGGVGTYNAGSSGVTTYWLGGSTSSLTSSSVAFTQTKMYGKKLSALTSIANDEIRFDVRGIEANTQLELLASIGQEEDSKFLAGDGSLGAPLGIYYLTPTANQLTMTATPTAAKAKKDLMRLVQAVAGGNSKLKKGTFIMSTNVKIALMAQVDANSNPMDYARELQQFGTIYGYQVVTSNNLASTQLIFVDAADIVIGTGYGLITDVDTSYGFATDSTYIRALQTTDVALAYTASAACLTNIDWSTSLF